MALSIPWSAGEDHEWKSGQDFASTIKTATILWLHPTSVKLLNSRDTGENIHALKAQTTKGNLTKYMGQVRIRSEFWTDWYHPKSQGWEPLLGQERFLSDSWTWHHVVRGTFLTFLEGIGEMRCHSAWQNSIPSPQLHSYADKTLLLGILQPIATTPCHACLFAFHKVKLKGMALFVWIVRQAKVIYRACEGKEISCFALNRYEPCV